jgi:hypothetical protein
MDRMARPLRLTALASLLATLACANTPEPGGGPTATRQTSPSPVAGDTAEPAPRVTERPSQLAAMVPVASTPDDARPCERMCGRVGDCLRERGDASDASHLRNAGHLELTCLDLCVNVEPGHDAGKRFAACDRRDSCEPLLECARNEWSATANARSSVVTVFGVSPASRYSTCELVCGGMYSCMNHNQPLHLLDVRSAQFVKDLQACMANCEPGSPSMVTLADCARAQTCEQQWDCWQRAQAY